MSISTRQPVVIPDQLDQPPIPSGNNTATYSPQDGSYVIAIGALASGAQVTLVTFNAKYFNNPLYTYRITLNYVVNTLTFGATPAGKINARIVYNSQYLTQTGVYINSNVTSLGIPFTGGSMSGVFVGGQSSLILIVNNDTGQSLSTGGQFVITSCCIEKVTTANTAVATFV